MSIKRSGIKSVDMKIESEGHGVVNWNGSASLFLNSDNQQKVDNHTLPKMRGVDIHRVSNHRQIDDNAKIYISQNCIRQAIFKDYSYGLKNVNLSNVSEVLSSLLGLVRGYVIAEDKTSLKRKSALYITDFNSSEDTKINFEQFSQAGQRDSTSIYSKHTASNTKYTAYASINIEDLQFLPLEDSLGRSCFKEVISEQEGIELAKKITQSIKDLDFTNTKKPEAVFSNNYIRINSICKTGEAGILLNDDAIDILVKEVVSLIQNLSIVRTSGYMTVTNVVVDYNDTNPLRMKNDIHNVEPKKETNYYVYYESKQLSNDEFKEKIKTTTLAKKEPKQKNGSKATPIVETKETEE